MQIHGLFLSQLLRIFQKAIADVFNNLLKQDSGLQIKAPFHQQSYLLISLILVFITEL